MRRTCLITLVGAALIAAAPFGSAAWAGTYGPVGCNLNSGHACTSAERHTYNDNYAYGPSNRYIASWLVNPSTGTNINVHYGYGTAGGYYRSNTDVFLDGWWGNYSGVSPVGVQGKFNY